MKIILGLMILILLVGTISAATITINMKDSFGTGDEISFDYTILSTTSQEIKYMVSVNCPNAPLPLLEIKSKNLTANIPLTENYIYISKISEDIEPQSCKAVVGILSPEETLESKNFSINTNPSFDLNILTCTEQSCINPTKVFILGENIYFNYDSNVSIITASLTYPDKTVHQLNLRDSIKAEQTGSYELEVSATKQGYKTITEKIQFGVIEKETEIGYVSLEALKDINEKESTSKTLSYSLIGAGVLAILVILFFFVRKIVLKRKSSNIS
jgi:hypothetical protein